MPPSQFHAAPRATDRPLGQQLGRDSKRATRSRRPARRFTKSSRPCTALDPGAAAVIALLHLAGCATCDKHPSSSDVYLLNHICKGLLWLLISPLPPCRVLTGKQFHIGFVFFPATGSFLWKRLLAFLQLLQHDNRQYRPQPEDRRSLMLPSLVPKPPWQLRPALRTAPCPSKAMKSQSRQKAALVRRYCLVAARSFMI